MKLKKQTLLMIMAFLMLFPLSIFAQQTSNSVHAAMPKGEMNHNNSQAGHEAMMQNMFKQENYTDKAFLSAMIPHHQAAIEMSREELAKGTNPEARTWAENIIKAQQTEIEQMRTWLQNMGVEDKNAASMMQDSMHKMMASSFGKNPDYNFVHMMVAHHAGAVEMALAAIRYSDNDQIIALAKQIINSQTDEIMAFRQWLKNNKQ